MSENYYWPGQTVEMDLSQAGEWYRKAALQGHPEARRKCEALGISLED